MFLLILFMYGRKSQALVHRNNQTICPTNIELEGAQHD